MFLRLSRKILFVFSLALFFVQAHASSTRKCYVLLGEPAQTTVPNTQSFSATVSSATPSIAGHMLGSAQKLRVIYPAMANWDGIFAAALSNNAIDSHPVTVFENATLNLVAPLLLPGSRTEAPPPEFKLLTDIQITGPLHFNFALNSATSTGKVSLRTSGSGFYSDSMTHDPTQFNFNESGLVTRIDSNTLYGEFASRGMTYQGLYRGLHDIEVQNDRSRGKITLNSNLMLESHAVPPAVLDSALHALAAIVFYGSGDWNFAPKAAAIPTRFGHVEYNSAVILSVGETLNAYARIIQITGEAPNQSIIYEVLLTNSAGDAILFIKNGEVTTAKLTKD